MRLRGVLLEYQENQKVKMYSRSFLQPENEDEVFLRLYDYVDARNKAGIARENRLYKK